MEHRALAQALRQHSFVVWKTKGEEDASTITSAFACMHRFFEENTPQHKQVPLAPPHFALLASHKVNAFASPGVRECRAGQELWLRRHTGQGEFYRT
jgi:hypothetical protein